MNAHFISTKPDVKICPRCQGVMLAGVAEGLTARVDVIALNPLGEIAAITAGLITYTLTRYSLIARDAVRIAGSTLRGPVLAAHRCRREVPAEQRLALPVPPAPVDPVDDLPPF